jgi:RNA polymerase sigma-70 factor (ECF subfamily)
MLQECWLRIHRSRHTYRPGTPVLPWLFAIARYTRIDAYRRRRQIDANELAVEDVAAAGRGEAALPDRVDLDLWRLVGQLPPSQQEVIQMLKVSGLSLEEVARATGSSVGAVKQKAHRAYQKLRELLNLDREATKGE